MDGDKSSTVYCRALSLCGLVRPMLGRPLRDLSPGVVYSLYLSCAAYDEASRLKSSKSLKGESRKELAFSSTRLPHSLPSCILIFRVAIAALSALLFGGNRPVWK